MKKAILTLMLAAMSTGAIASPLRGELFGFRIGSKYPVSKNTKVEDDNLRWSYLIWADKPQKPANFGSVKMMTTTKSHTIFHIYSDTEFASTEEAVDFATGNSGLLRTKYGSKCSERRVDPQWGPLALTCGEYELSVRYFVVPEHPKGPRGVRIGINAEGGKVNRELSKLMVTEAQQRDAEIAKRQLEQAEQNNKMKGL